MLSDSSTATISLVNRLRAFNAKERYWLVRQALGGFEPTPKFANAIANAAGLPSLTEAQRSNAFLAMDYHLNWMHAAMSVHEGPGQTTWFDNVHASGHDGLPRSAIENSQEDVDLLLAYPREEDGRALTQMLLVEAKCAGAFEPKQLLSKLDRLKLIVEQGRKAGFSFDARLVLMGPVDPSEALSSVRFRLDYPMLIATDTVPFVPLEIDPFDDRGFWKVRPRDRQGVTKDLVSNDPRRAWPNWTISIRKGTQPNTTKN